MDQHIAELAELGVAPPSQVPLFYRVSATLLTQSETIQVLGTVSSGEAEPLIVRANGRLWLGLASDHTDRELESHSIAHSKQICPKPVADILWDYAQLQAHQDELILRSWVWESDQWKLYQDGPLSAILPLDRLIQACALDDQTALLCGTLPAIGGVRHSNSFKMELFDPRLDRRIQTAYRIKSLPVIS